MRRAISKIGEKSEEVEGEDAIFVPFPFGDCVAMERPRGEAVGFQSFRTRVFYVWESTVGSKSNVFIWLATHNPNG